MDGKNLNLSQFHSVPPSEIEKAAERALGANDDESIEAWVALFRNRALRLVRTGSSSDLRTESAAINRHLFSAAGHELRRHHPEYHARLRMIAEMLNAAGQRTDTMFIFSILGRNYARPIVELLAKAGPDGLPRKQLLEHFGIEESHLTHILADLQAADVVIRHRRAGAKEVRVTLGTAGLDFVEQTLVPRWFIRVLDLVRKAITGAAPRNVAAVLEKADVPSSMAVDKVKELLDAIAAEKQREPVTTAYARG